MENLLEKSYKLYGKKDIFKGTFFGKKPDMDKLNNISNITINKLLNRYHNLKHIRNKSFSSNKYSFTIGIDNDDYYFVEISPNYSSSSVSYWYKCDQFGGLISFFREKVFKG